MKCNSIYLNNKLLISKYEIHFPVYNQHFPVFLYRCNDVIHSGTRSAQDINTAELLCRKSRARQYE